LREAAVLDDHLGAGVLRALHEVRVEPSEPPLQ
jgi:hypothetical protein